MGFLNKSQIKSLQQKIKNIAEGVRDDEVCVVHLRFQKRVRNWRGVRIKKFSITRIIQDPTNLSESELALEDLLKQLSFLKINDKNNSLSLGICSKKNMNILKTISGKVLAY